MSDDVAPRLQLPAWLDAPARAMLARKSRWPHALLIAGPEGVGKRLLAMYLARARVCETPRDDGTACEHCASCRYAAAGQHPDLRIVEPVEVDEEGTAKPTEWIRIVAIRELIDWAQVSAHRGGSKIAIVAPAERMNLAAANALLKTLEEPSAGTYLILASHQPGRLPATITSRCERLVVPLPESGPARAWLTAQGSSDAEALLAQAGGAPLLARALDDPGLQSERAAWLDALEKPDSLAPLALAARIEAAGRDERRDRLALALDWLIGWTGDLARSIAGGGPLRSPDRAVALDALARRVARISLFRYHRELLRQRTLLTFPLQPRLVAEALLIDYRALFD